MRRVLSSFAMLVLLAPAAARATHERQDFNGDGYGDLAVGAPGEDVGKAKEAGSVNVIYGSPSGPAAAGNQFWTQDSAGIADKAETGDAFGTSLAAADLNGDGYPDLVIGVPGEDLPGKPDNGAVHVLFGSPSGLRAAGSRFYADFSAVYAAPVASAEVDTKTVAPQCAITAEIMDHLPSSRDLAIVVGCPGADRGKTDSGAVVLIDGSTGDSNYVLAQGEFGIAGTKEKNDRWGTEIAAGFFNLDSIQDLAVAAPGEDLGSIKDAGAINVLFGGANGVTGVGNQFIHENATLFGVPVEGQAKKNEHFGSALESVHLASSGRGLVVGSPGDGGGLGFVHFFPAGSFGLESFAQLLGDLFLPTQSSGIASIGAALRGIDLNFDGTTDRIAVGAPGSSPSPALHEAGAVLLLSPTANGFTLNPSIVIGTGPEEYLGAALNALDATDSFFPHLLASAPGHDEDRGQVLWLSLQNFGSHLGAYTQDSTGIKDSAEKGDAFGVLAGSRYVGAID